MSIICVLDCIVVSVCRGLLYDVSCMSLSMSCSCLYDCHFVLFCLCLLILYFYVSCFYVSMILCLYDLDLVCGLYLCSRLSADRRTLWDWSSLYDIVGSYFPVHASPSAATEGGSKADRWAIQSEVYRAYLLTVKNNERVVSFPHVPTYKPTVKRNHDPHAAIPNLLHATEPCTWNNQLYSQPHATTNLDSSFKL